MKEFMRQKQTFAPLDAMEVRTKFGGILDRVELKQERFAIQRRGKIKALLVPVSDKHRIKVDIKEDEIGKTYKALKEITGSIIEPHASDASTTVDKWLYGQGDKHIGVE